ESILRTSAESQVSDRIAYRSEPSLIPPQRSTSAWKSMSKPASLGWPGPLLRLKSIDSTQDLAKRLAENGGTDRTLIIAERQTKGRGRLRRRWTSDPGGLYLSILFRPQVSPRRLAELSLAFAGA